MRTRKTIYLAALALLVCGALSAQTAANSVTLTADQAVEYALKNSYAIKSGAVDLSAAKRKAQTAAASTFLPSVSVTGTATRQNELGKSTTDMLKLLGGADEMDQWMLVAPGISASWSFSVAMIDQVAAAQASYKAGQITWEQTLRETELTIRKLFYGLLVQQEQLEVQQTALRNARSRMTQALANYQNGRVPQLSYLQAQVAYENQRPTVLQTEQKLSQSLETFAFLLGMDTSSKVVLSGSIDPKFLQLDADALIDTYLKQRFDYVSLTANIEVLEKNLAALNHSSFLPALNVQWGLQPVQSLSSKTAYADNVKGENGSLSITLAWNVTNMLPFSSNRQQAADLKGNLEKLEISRSQLTENAKNEIRAKVDTLTLNQANIAAMQANVELARTAYNMTATAYQNGATELLDVRDAEKSLVDARLGLTAERMNYITGVLELEYALNTRLE